MQYLLTLQVSRYCILVLLVFTLIMKASLLLVLMRNTQKRATLFSHGLANKITSCRIVVGWGNVWHNTKASIVPTRTALHSLCSQHQHDQRTLITCQRNRDPIFPTARQQGTHRAHDVFATLIQRRNNVVCPVGRDLR